MAGITNKEYYNLVDENLVLFGGGAPCANVDGRMWTDFKELYKEYSKGKPTVTDWSFDDVSLWIEEFKKWKLEQEKNR